MLKKIKRDLRFLGIFHKAFVYVFASTALKVSVFKKVFANRVKIAKIS